MLGTCKVLGSIPNTTKKKKKKANKKPGSQSFGTYLDGPVPFAKP
jgi:hypothetical protein